MQLIMRLKTDASADVREPVSIIADSVLTRGEEEIVIEGKALEDTSIMSLMGEVSQNETAVSLLEEAKSEEVPK
jgi:hypothetical protein